MASSKPTDAKGAVLREPVSTPARYNAQLQRLVDKMVAAAAKDIVALFTSPTAAESHVTTDASISSQARILTNSLMDRFTLLFNRAARPLSEAMVEETLVNSQTGMRRSLKEISAKVTLAGSIAGAPNSRVRQVAKASVTENVALIKSIPQQYLGKVQQAVMRSITTGNGLQDLQPFLTKTIARAQGLDLKDAGKQIDSVKRRAKNIALDQTRKAYNSINAARMQANGIEKFEWIHTGGGQKPRQQHIEMSGSVYSFAELPVIDNNTGERGIPGQLPNCRCTMRPIVDLSFGETDE